MRLLPLLPTFLLPFFNPVYSLRFPLVKKSDPSHTNFALKYATNYLAASGISNPAASDDPNDIGFTTTRDLLYIANITLGSDEYPVQLDTGSSDLWVLAPTTLPGTAPSVPATPLNLSYGIGSASGQLAQGPVQFAGFKIKDQAFLAVTESDNPVSHFGAVGILGLGFTTLSAIDAAVRNKLKANWGKSLLYNAFLQYPDEPNYIAFALQRSLDPTSEVTGSFTIGEVEPKYSAISNTPHIPTWPVSNPTRWQVLLDSYTVKGQRYALSSSVSRVPRGKAVVLLDSGTSYTYADPSIVETIYGGLPGASYDSKLKQWTMPCSTGIHVSLQFGGVTFDLHPLDVVQPSLAVPDQCIGTFIPQKLAVGANEFDWIIGDSVLRSMYSLYDFGDFDSARVMGDPYVQLLSLVNITSAAADFKRVRGGDVIVVDAGSTAAVTPANAAPDPLDKLASYAPIGLALLGFNALVLTIGLVAGFWYFCRRQQNAKNTNSSPPLALTSVSAHAYEPVPASIPDDDAASVKYDPPASDSRPPSLYQASLRPASINPASSRPASTYQASIRAPSPPQEHVDPTLIEAALLPLPQTPVHASPQNFLSPLQTSPQSTLRPTAYQSTSRPYSSYQQATPRPTAGQTPAPRALSAYQVVPDPTGFQPRSSPLREGSQTRPRALSAYQPPGDNTSFQPRPSPLRDDATGAQVRPRATSAYQPIPPPGLTNQPRVSSGFFRDDGSSMHTKVADDAGSIKSKQMDETDIGADVGFMGGNPGVAS